MRKRLFMALMAIVLVVTSVLPAMAYPKRRGDIYRGDGPFYDRHDRDVFYRPMPRPHYGPWAQRRYDMHMRRNAMRELTELIYDLRMLKRVLRDQDPWRY